MYRGSGMESRIRPQDIPPDRELARRCRHQIPRLQWSSLCSTESQHTSSARLSRSSRGGRTSTVRHSEWSFDGIGRRVLHSRIECPGWEAPVHLPLLYLSRDGPSQSDRTDKGNRHEDPLLWQQGNGCGIHSSGQSNHRTGECGGRGLIWRDTDSKAADAVRDWSTRPTRPLWYTSHYPPSRCWPDPAGPPAIGLSLGSTGVPRNDFCVDTGHCPVEERS